LPSVFIYILLDVVLLMFVVWFLSYFNDCLMV